MLMIVNFISPDDRYNDIYLSNFATINIRDELLRVPGVSDINVMGQRDYSIRVWLKPQDLAARGMTAIDVANAIRNQNLDAPAGQMNMPPSLTGQSFQWPINTLGRLNTPEQFGDIVVKVTQPTPASAGRAMAPPRATTLGMPDTGTGTSGTQSGSSSSADSSSGGSSSSSSSTTGSTSSAAVGVSTSGGATSTGGGTIGGAANSSGGGTTGGAGFRCFIDKQQRERCRLERYERHDDWQRHDRFVVDGYHCGDPIRRGSDERFGRGGWRSGLEHGGAADVGRSRSSS